MNNSPDIAPKPKKLIYVVFAAAAFFSVFLLILWGNVTYPHFRSIADFIFADIFYALAFITLTIFPFLL
ncbi:MAG: hypothetical protein AAB518_00005, partial [Patescibacteria group bacterium]